MTSTPSGHFNISITFPNVIQSNTDVQEDGSFSSIISPNSPMNAMEKWGFFNHKAAAEDGSGGIICGGKDGSLYVFGPSNSNVTGNIVGEEFPIILSPPTRSGASSRSSSGQRITRPDSSSSFTNPRSPKFAMSARPRVVSGLTTEAVEAPKNYVDFVDEPDKLKDILKGRAPREKQHVSETSTSSEKSNRNSVGSIPPEKRRNLPRSLLSTAKVSQSSSPTSPRSTASPAPDFKPLQPPDVQQKWRVLYHLVPSLPSLGSCVTSIQILEDVYAAVLVEAGVVYVITINDGSYVCSFDLADASTSDSQSAEGTKALDKWSWYTLSTRILRFKNQPTIFLIATGTLDMNTISADGSSEQSQSIVLEFISTPSDPILAQVGHWDFTGSPQGHDTIIRANDELQLFCVNHDGHLLMRDLSERLATPPIVLTSTSDNDVHHMHLSIPNPFKGMASRSSENLVPPPSPGFSRNLTLELSDPMDLGPIIPCSNVAGLRMIRIHDAVLGLVWSADVFSTFEYRNDTLRVLFTLDVIGVKQAIWIDRSTFSIGFKTKVEVYRLQHVNADHDFIPPPVDSTASQAAMIPELVRSVNVEPYDSIRLGHDCVLTTTSIGDHHKVIVYPLYESNESQCPYITPTVIWDFGPASTALRCTSALPLDTEHIVHGYSDGRLRQHSLRQLLAKAQDPSTNLVPQRISNPPVDGYLIGLHVVQNPRTKENLIVGGADDGSVVLWSTHTFQVIARWNLFVAPLAQVVQFLQEQTGPLRGCALCVSQDGTIAVIVIDGPHFLHLIPGSPSPLKRICLGGDNLMMLYANKRARLWDAQTKELWRSMGIDKAEEMLAQGSWRQLDIHSDRCLPHSPWRPISHMSHGNASASTLRFDLEQFVVGAIATTKTISTSKNEIREILSTLEKLRQVLSMMLTPGLNEAIDSICYEKLKVQPSSTWFGYSRPYFSIIYPTNSPGEAWCISEQTTASRALSIVAILRAMSLFEELAEPANVVIMFYTTSLRNYVGPKYQPPCLELLGKMWFEASVDLRQSIRTLFDASVSALSDEEALKITEVWQHQVPTLQPEADKESTTAALGLFICGCVASEKYSLLSTHALTDISKSISLYLHDEKSIYRVLAIDLCSRGFHVWQHYIDSLEILRSLINLATNMRKDGISAQNVATQARQSVLSIASNNMPLLMGALCLDILSPPTVEHRRSVLQIVAFLIRKRAYVLQSHLPRLIEAVVKSLDPNSTSNREIILDSATEIIGFVVKTFPSVDFHMASQRLAVGTNEGAIIMYDLKTAIRLYVLEGHKKSITACSFSPDGRRLVTLSLKESVLLVWKVGTSFVSFFNPGAPPRQGHGGSQPFKTLNFGIGPDSEMTTAETLDLVRVEWVGERTVRIMIRQNVFTFST